MVSHALTRDWAKAFMDVPKYKGELLSMFEVVAHTYNFGQDKRLQYASPPEQVAQLCVFGQWQTVLTTPQTYSKCAPQVAHSIC